MYNAQLEISTMQEVQDVPIGNYLAGLMELVLRASTGPFVIEQGTGSWHTVTAERGGPALATFAQRADAELFARALPDLRAATAALVETLGLHRDAGFGRCAQDGQEVPCLTQRVLTAQLAPRAAAT